MPLIPCPCGCGRTFEPVEIGGHKKKFATPECKKRIESAVRKWGMKAFEDGLLSPDALKPFLPSRATATEQSRDSGVS